MGRLTGLLKKVSSRWGVRIASVTVVLVAWQLIGTNKTYRFFISQPTEVAQAFLDMVLSGRLLAAFSLSVQHLIIGFALASITGISIGLAMGMFKRIEWAVNPLISALYVTPLVALIPMLILIFGVNIITSIITVYLFAFIPIVVNTFEGVKSVNLNLVEAARSYGARNTHLFSKVFLPGAFPFIVTGLRIGVGRAFRAMVLADIFLLTGIGGLIEIFGLYLDVASLFATVFLIIIMGISLVEVVKYAEKRVLYWKEAEV